jgi:ATP-dependent Clp protease ATP-binding subunit ClpC
MTRDSVRVEVEDTVGLGKKQPTGHIPFTPRAKKTLELSLREALAIKHNYIGTEHILLGVIREGDGVAAQIMSRHADLRAIRAAVLDAIPDTDPGEGAEAAEETNTVLRWLRQRLTGRNAPAVASRSSALGGEAAVRGTPAVEAALKEAAALAGRMPVGSHHLLLAALADTNSAASWALAQLGVDTDDLREKLRAAKVTGTSDEQPEQAGRRQMSIQVTDEMLTLVLTDPVIVEAAREALRAVNARSAGGAAGEETSGKEAPAEAAEADESSSGEAAGKSSTGTVIRGDLPEAAGLADVWLELRHTLNTIADPNPRAPLFRQARKLQGTPRLAASIKDDAPAGEGDPDKPEAAGS